VTGFLLASVFLVLMTAVAVLPKAVTWDPAYGILAAMQHEAGVSPNAWTLVQASPANLCADKPARVTWWAPLYQGVPLAVHHLGVTWGAALKMTIIASLLVGAVGWWIYFGLFTRKGSAACLLLIMLCSAFTLGAATEYQGGDLLLWAVAPHVVVLNILAMRRRNTGFGVILAILCGFLSVLLYTVKYSGVFVGIGLFAAWVVQIFLSERSLKGLGAWIAGAIGGVAMLKWWGLFGVATPVATPGGKHVLDALRGIQAFGIWPTAMTDLGAVLESVSGKLVLSPAKAVALNAAAGWIFIAMLVILALGARFRWKEALGQRAEVTGFDRSALLVALCVIGADLVLYAGVVATTASVAVEPRLARMAGCFALPLVFCVVSHVWSQNRRLWRLAAWGLATVFFIVPPVFGIARLFDHVRKLHPRSREVLVQPGLMNQHFKLEDEANRFAVEFRSHVKSEQTVVYTTYPTMLYSFPAQRCLIVEAVELYSEAELRGRSYVSPPAEGIALLLPMELAKDGKLETIKASFRDVSKWEYVALKSVPDWGLWVSAK
jgi:hypothetical protein